MSIGERLKKAMEYADSSAYKLNKATKISQSTIGRILKNENIPNRTTLLLICEFLGVNIDWLETGTGEMIASKANNIEVEYLNAETSSIMFVPLVTQYSTLE